MQRKKTFFPCYSQKLHFLLESKSWRNRFRLSHRQVERKTLAWENFAGFSKMPQRRMSEQPAEEILQLLPVACEKVLECEKHVLFRKQREKCDAEVEYLEYYYVPV